MRIYKVGDRVRVQPLASDIKKYHHSKLRITNGMLQHSNKQATILYTSYNESLGEHVYQIDLDNRYWYWVSQFFCPPKLLKRKQIC